MKVIPRAKVGFHVAEVVYSLLVILWYLLPYISPELGGFAPRTLANTLYGSPVAAGRLGGRQRPLLPAAPDLPVEDRLGVPRAASAGRLPIPRGRFHLHELRFLGHRRGLPHHAPGQRRDERELLRGLLPVHVSHCRGVAGVQRVLHRDVHHELEQAGRDIPGVPGVPPQR